MLGCKPSPSPSNAKVQLYQDDSHSYEDIQQYRRFIDQLLYLTTTRPDIAFPTQQLSQFLANPTLTHYQATQKILRYLKGSPGKGIFFPRSSSVQFQGLSHVDWGCKTLGSGLGSYALGFRV